MTTKTVELSDFAFQCVVAHVPSKRRQGWYDNAVAELFKKAQIGKNYEIRNAESVCDDSVPKKVIVGLKVLGFRADKKYKGKGVLLAGAAFHPTTKKLVAWTYDLDAIPRPTNLIIAMDKKTYTAVLDKDGESRLRALAGAGAAAKTAPPSQSAPFAHDNNIRSLAVSADGTRLATVGDDKKLAIWDLNTQAAIARVPAGTGFHAAFSPDGSLVAVGGWQAVVYRATDGKKLFTLPMPSDASVVALRFSPSGRWVAFGIDAAKRRMVVMLDAKTGKTIAHWKVEAYGIIDMAFDDERALVVHALHVGDTTNYFVLPLTTLPGSKPVDAPPPVSAPGKVAFGNLSFDGASTLDFDRAVLTTRRGKTAKTWTAPGEIAAAAWTPAGTIILALGVRAQVWDPKKQALV